MTGKRFRVGVAAASSRFSSVVSGRLTAHVAATRPNVELVFHPDAFREHGHFAGDDATRAQALLDLANDPSIDAIWFGRGGYGACRIAETVMSGLTDVARAKRWLGYSDVGSLLAGLYRLGFPHIAHGPMGADVLRPGGEAAVDRALDWLETGAASSLEPNLDGRPTVAFNVSVLGALLGTALEPDLTGHVLMLEEVSEPLYRLDRELFHITGQPAIRRVAGIRLGRVSEIVANEPDFLISPEMIMRDWCERSGIPFLGAADIGHDTDNKVVPFGPGHRVT